MPDPPPDSASASTPSINPSPLPSIGHLSHPDPTAGPTQLSYKHPHLVNYAISAGAVLLGIAFIAAFALFVRWRRRRYRSRILDNHIDERIRHSIFSSQSTTTPCHNPSFLKLPPSSLSNVSDRDPTAFQHLSFNPSFSHSANSSQVSLPRSRHSALSVSDLRLPCRCPECTSLARPTTLARLAYGTGAHPPDIQTATNSQPQAPSRNTTFASARFPRISGVVASLRSSISRNSSQSGLPTRNYFSSTVATQPPTDENARRRQSLRTPPIRVPSFLERTWVLERSTAAIHPASGFRSQGGGFGIGITVDHSVASEGNTSPTSSSSTAVCSTHCLPTPLITTSSPVLSLSDDAGVTMLPQASTRADTGITTRSSFDLAAASLGHLQDSLPYLGAVSPGSPNEDPESPFPLTPANPNDQEPGTSNLHTWDTAADLKSSRGNTDSTAEHERWFTEVDWFGDDSPLPLEDFDRQPSVYSESHGGYLSCSNSGHSD